MPFWSVFFVWRFSFVECLLVLVSVFFGWEGEKSAGPCFFDIGRGSIYTRNCLSNEAQDQDIYIYILYVLKTYAHIRFYTLIHGRSLMTHDRLELTPQVIFLLGNLIINP